MNDSPNKACAVCLAPGDAVNHLDHLVVISYILQVPIITDEDSVYASLKKYYPQVKPVYIREHQKILEYLSQHYDTLFVSCANYKRDLSPLFEIIFRRQINFWYCPHGNSDKPMTQFELQNHTLVYGDQMVDRLDEIGVTPKLDSFVRTGNYRFPFYKEHEEFYDQIAEDEVFSQFEKKQTTLMYAPTWRDLEFSSSLFDVGIPIVDQLPDHYNLIVKLHPWLQHHQAGHVHLLKEKYNERPNITVQCLYPLVLPLLKRTDIYLGDFSSIGYDYLYYNRPMFFFDPNERDKTRAEGANLHSCGIVIPENRYNDIYTFIEENLQAQDQYKTARSSLYEYAFGKERSFEELRGELIDKMLLQEPSSDLL